MTTFSALIISAFWTIFAEASIRSFPPNWPHHAPQIDVLIGKSLKNIVISGVDLRRELFQGKNSKQHSGQKSVKFVCDFPRSVARKGAMLLAQVSSPTGIISWNSDQYRGEFLIATPEELQGCYLINRISLENYLSTLLAKEMNPHWPLEALKAQAVAARTYALYQMQMRRNSLKSGKRSFFDLENSEKYQVNGTLSDETRMTAMAAKMTKGEVLLPANGNLGPIFFHSKCGGKTLLPSQVWDKKEEGYRSVSCPFCKLHGPPSWKFSLSQNDFMNFINKYGRRIENKALDGKAVLQGKGLFVHPDRMENHSLRIDVDERLLVLNKIYLRRFLGREKIRSNYFHLEREGQEILVRGEGNGHGVGLCQFGALRMADLGRNYKEILKHYFPHHTLKNIY